MVAQSAKNRQIWSHWLLLVLVVVHTQRKGNGEGKGGLKWYLEFGFNVVGSSNEEDQM